MPTAIEGSLIVVYQPVATLISYPHNPRTHSNHQIRQLARSITEFGFTNPILLEKNNTIVAGHGRLLAAQMLGMEEVSHHPTRDADGVSDSGLCSGR